MPDEIELFRFWMPPDQWRKTRRLSRWPMTREEAAARGLTEPDLTTREVRRGPGADHAGLGTSWKLNLPPDKE
jgi:hypothetical protein